MGTTLTRDQLDGMGCGTPNCGHGHTVLHLHAACHPSAGTRASYDKRTGALTIECVKCKKLVAHVKVAAE
jgi:hypothetical protein